MLSENCRKFYVGNLLIFGIRGSENGFNVFFDFLCNVVKGVVIGIEEFIAGNAGIIELNVELCDFAIVEVHFV